MGLFLLQHLFPCKKLSAIAARLIRSIEFWTKNSQKFWLSGSRPRILKSDFLPPRDAGGHDSRLTRTLKKKIVRHFTCHAIGNSRYCCLNIGKFLLMILLTCPKFKQRNVFKNYSILRCLCPTVRPERFPVEKLKPVTKRVIPEMRVLIY